MARLPGWRDRAATDLLLKHLDHLHVEGPALVMEDPWADDVAAALREHTDAVTVWSRRVRGDGIASPWPPAAALEPTGYRAAFLRLPKSRDELEMSAHAAAHRMAPVGRLFVYGAKDEGAASTPGRLEPLFPEAWTVATGGRCRLIEAPLPSTSPGHADIPGLRAPLDAWSMETDPPHPDITADRWISYPGVFAAGRLDDGTALLLEHLPDLNPSPASAGGTPRVLDFGCGDGVVSAVLVGRPPGLAPEMLDVDTVALAAAAENVPPGLPIPADGIASLGRTPPYDAIVSNPPYHRGKAETVEVVRELVLGAAERLADHGSLTIVVQRRLPVDTALHRAFRSVEVVADRGAFRVWRGTRPAAGR